MTKKSSNRIFTSHCDHFLILRKRLEKYGVTSFSFGARIRDGKQTNEYSLICYIPKKLNKNDLAVKDLIPNKFIYQVAGDKFEIKTDVVQAKPKIVLQSEVVPGEKVFSPSQNATIGLIGIHEKFGNILVTAGHFAKQDEKVVVPVDNNKFATANVEFSLSGSAYDFAYLKFMDNVVYPKYPRWSGYYDATKYEEIGKMLYVATKKYGFVKTICRSVSGYFHDSSNNVYYDNVILTDRVTFKGDSGAALVDNDQNVWGLLIGAYGNRSLFMPVRNLLAYGNIQLK